MKPLHPHDIAYRIVLLFSFACTFAVAFPAAVYAQASGGVDLTPAANTLITTVAGALTVAAGTISWFLVRFLSSKARINNTQLELMVQQQVDHVLVMAIQFGEAWLKEQVSDPRSPIKSLSFNNLFLDVALGYFKSSLPDLINAQRARFSDERIKNLITSRVAPYLKPPVVDGGALQTMTADAVVPSPLPTLQPTP